MAAPNYFDRFGAVPSIPAAPAPAATRPGQSNYFDRFDAAPAARATPTAPAPAPAGGGILDFLGRVGEGFGNSLERVAGGLSTVAGAGARAVGAEDVADYFARDAAMQNRRANRAVEGNTTWEQVKENPNLGNIGMFAAEQGLSSIPDMALVMAAPWLYGVSRAGTIGQERANNNGTGPATVWDIAKAAPAAGGSVLLERFGTKGILGDAGTGIAGVGKAGGREGLTEAGQSGLEYTGSNLGTVRGFDPYAAGDQMAAGLVAGTPFGAGANATIQVGGKVRDYWTGRGVDVDGISDEDLVAGSLDGTIGGGAGAADVNEILKGAGFDPASFTDPAAMAARVEAARARPSTNDLGPEEVARQRGILDAILEGNADPATAPRPVARTMPEDVPIIAAPEGNVRGDDIGGMVGLERKRAADANVFDRAREAALNDPVIGTILDSDVSPQTKLATVWDRLRAFREGTDQDPDYGDVPAAPPIPGVPEQMPTPRASPYQAPTPAAARGGEKLEGGLEGYLAATRRAESGTNDNADNPRSSADGRYQFTDGTFRQYFIKEYGRDPGRSPPKALKNDVEVQERLMRSFTEDNAAALRRARVPINNGTLYAAHHFGSGGAIAMGRNPNAPVAADVVAANPQLRGMTNGQALQWASNYVGSKGGGEGFGDAAPGSSSNWRMAAPEASTIGGEYSAATRPINDNTTFGGAAEDLSKPISPTQAEINIGETVTGKPVEGGPMGTGRSDRAFRDVSDDPDDLPGFWENRARATAEEAAAKAQADLEAEWERRRKAQEERERRGGQTRFEEERTASDDPSGRYKGKYGQKPAKDADFWRTTDDGYVADKDGKPVAFRNAREAATWAAKNEMGGDFELRSWAANSSRIVLQRRDGSTYGTAQPEATGAAPGPESATDAPGRTFQGNPDYDGTATPDSAGKALGAPPGAPAAPAPPPAASPPTPAAVWAADPGNADAVDIIERAVQRGDAAWLEGRQAAFAKRQAEGQVPAAGAPDYLADAIARARGATNPVTPGATEAVTPTPATNPEVPAAPEPGFRTDDLGREPKRPSGFISTVRGWTKRKSEELGVPVRISAEDAESQGVPAADIFVDPNNPRKDRRRIKVGLVDVFSSKYGSMNSKQVELRDLDAMGDELDYQQWGLEYRAGGRVTPEEIGTLLAADLERSDDALDRNDPNYDAYVDWQARAADYQEYLDRAEAGESSIEENREGVDELLERLVEAGTNRTTAPWVPPTSENEYGAGPERFDDGQRGQGEPDAEAGGEDPQRSQVSSGQQGDGRTGDPDRQPAGQASQDDAFGTRPGDERTALERRGEGRLKGQKEQKAPGSDGGLFDPDGSKGRQLFLRSRQDGIASDVDIRFLSRELDELAKTSRNPAVRTLASRLRPLVDDAILAYGGDLGPGIKGMTNLYPDGTASASVRSPADVDALLHEAIHVATLTRYGELVDGSTDGTAAAEPVQELEALLVRARKAFARRSEDPTGEIEAAMESVDELLAYGLTSPPVQQFLKRHNTAGLWGRFVNGVRGILGLEPKYGTILERVLASGAKVIQAMPKDPTFRQSNGATLYARSSAFRDWFSDSKVVDKNGDPQVVYHGTADDIEAFDASKRGGLTGAESAKKAFWFTDRKGTADYYAKAAAREKNLNRGFTYDEDGSNFQRAPEAKAAIMQTYLSLQNPLVVDMKNRVYRDKSFSEHIDQAQAAGHDGVIFKRAFDSGEYGRFDALMRGRLRGDTIYAAFSPTQIKSVDNRGTFDPSDPRVLYARGGGIDPDPKGFAKLVDAFADVDGIKADASAIRAAIGKPSTALKSFTEPMGRVISAGMFTNDARVRGLAAKFKSKALEEYADLWHARAGKGDGTGRTYHEAVARAATTRTQRAYETLEPFLKNEASIGRIKEMLTNPNKTVRSTQAERDAAKEMRELLKETIDYRKKAGEDIGEVTDGYFPRILSVERVLKGKDEFLKRAEQLYRSHGVEDPKAAAGHWFERVFDEYAGLDGGFGFVRGPSGGLGTTTAKAREFGKQADSLLKDFYEPDVFHTMSAYFTGAAKRAEYARRFGMPGEAGSTKRDAWMKEHGEKNQFDVLMNRIKEDVRSSGEKPAGVLQVLDSVHRSNLGQMGTADPFARTAVSYLHTWNQLQKMDRVTITSLGELTMGFIRGGPRYGFPFLKDSMQEFARQLRKADPTDAYRWAEAIGVANDAMVNQVLTSRISAENATAGAQKVLAGFYKGIGLHQFTEGTRVAAVKMGRKMIDTFAHDLEAKSPRVRKRAELYLKELGVKDVAAFGERIRKGGFTRDDVLGDQGMAGEYGTALLRLTNQTIMMPSRAEKPTWSAHPVGSLVFSLMSYSYGFKKNVLDRGARLAVQGYKEKDAGLLLPALSLTIMAAFQGFNDTYLRPFLFGSSYDFESESPTEFLMRVADRSGFTGGLSPIINAIKAVRYDRSLLESLSGPVVGTLGNTLQKIAVEPFTDRNSPNTATAERNAASAFYDAVLDPMIDGFAAARLKGAVRSAAILGTGNREGGIAPGDKDAFVDAFGGEEEE
ncbi:MAG TPA: hypothetical protein VGR19_08720 [Allosphingosinicella sp.]|nr:hypothetical protein [Allosphingosinicella sp.]